MANIDAKRTIRTFKDFSLGLSANGGGGSVVVTELPEVGDEHTIYELQETTKDAYNWVAYAPGNLENDGFSISMISSGTFIFDTYEQMTSVFENITQPSKPLMYYLAYIRTEDKLYVMQPNRDNWSFEERVKVSAYTFARPDSEIGNIYVLKSYEGYDVATEKYYGTVYDGTRVELNSGQDVCFILTQVVDYGQMDYGLLFNKYKPYPVTQLPTAQEAVANYLDELIANNGWINVEIDGQLKHNMSDNGNYYWMNNPEIGAPNFYTGREELVVYTGELQWEDIHNSTFDNIPYQEIIDEKTTDWEFHPQKGGEIVSSYWIYTNNEWVNVDEIDTEPSLHKTIFGTLTYTGDESILQCSLTLEEIADAIAQGNFVVLELNMGDESKENYYYCAVSEVTVGGEGPDSVTITATWSFAQGCIEWNSNDGTFAFNNGMM